MPIDPQNLSGTATLTFSEDFNALHFWNGTTGLDTRPGWAMWPNYDQGYTLSNNGEQEWYTQPGYAPTSSIDTFSVNNGVLSIRAQKTPSNLLSQTNNQPYTSGTVDTYHEFSQTYGYFEMRAQLPSGQGLWPAFWLLREDSSWPPELDVMEQLGNNPNQIYFTAHSQASGTHTQVGSAAQVDNTSTGFHTYGVNWQPDNITWYFDGQAIGQAATPADMHSPMYMIANLAVGGYWPGNPDSSTNFPATMNIDYIRAYSGLPSGSAAATGQAASTVTGASVTTSAASSSGVNSSSANPTDPPAANSGTTSHSTSVTAAPPVSGTAQAAAPATAATGTQNVSPPAVSSTVAASSSTNPASATTPTSSSTLPVGSPATANGMANIAAAGSGTVTPVAASSSPSLVSGTSRDTLSSPPVGSAGTTSGSADPNLGAANTVPSAPSASTGTDQPVTSGAFQPAGVSAAPSTVQVMAAIPAGSTGSAPGAQGTSASGSGTPVSPSGAGDATQAALSTPANVASLPGDSYSAAPAPSGPYGSTIAPQPGTNPAFQAYVASPKARSAALSAEKKIIRYANKHPETVGAANKLLEMFAQFW